MSKRKARYDLYDASLPRPKWPRWDEPEEWTQNDVDSAMMINTLHLEPTYGNQFIMFIKVSRFIQALDLADFDDYDFIVDVDSWRARFGETPPRVHHLALSAPPPHVSNLSKT